MEQKSRKGTNCQLTARRGNFSISSLATVEILGQNMNSKQQGGREAY